jgi:hypothetical protein
VDNPDILSLSDDELWRRTSELAANERAAVVELVEHLAALDDRRLWLKHEYRGLFEYCVFGLRLSDDAAYSRIRAARAIRLFPPILMLMRDGRLSLTAVVRLHPFLEEPDAAALVQGAVGLRTKELESFLADRQPPGPQKDVVRFIPSTAAAPPALPDESSPLLEFKPLPLPAVENASVALRTPVKTATPPSARIAFTADAEFLKMMHQARSLLRHKYPDGRLEGVFREALRALLDKRVLGPRWRSRREAKPTAAARPRPVRG